MRERKKYRRERPTKTGSDQQEIAVRKAAEEKLPESREMLRLILDNIPQRVFWKDRRSVYLGGNKAFLKDANLVGLEELIGKNDHDLWKETAELFRRDDRTVMETKIPKLNYEEYQPGPKGPMWVRTSKIPLCDSRWSVIGILGVYEDITESKRAEEEIKNTLTKLAEAKDMLVQSEKLSAIGRLAAGVVHEILNPVNIMSMIIQMTESNENLSKKGLENLRLCREQIQRIVKISGDLNQFARVSPRQVVEGDLNEIVEQVIRLVKPRLKMENISVDLRLQQDLPRLLLDRDRISQVVLNIVNNAIDVVDGKKEKCILITTGLTESGPGKAVVMAISDNGTGIEKELAAKIFDPFFTTKEKGKGTGLGLSISYGIVEDHSGRIWAENNDWGGATFFIEFPWQTETSI